ncbi:hypothetical protein [Nocardioides sp. AE5]|uniref:hypothetical protein n=1 Tax=Nocardioides sp. AE5 TaxID=2962573 RepID=UPI002881364C|nr:hypothetical protein [Nocardioides sp. AE5]MDT0201394.1 hypothetical protein [Nocardioides sp. AE5]
MASKESVAAWLGAEALDGLDTCSTAELDELCGLLQAAMEREDAAVESGLAATLKAVPRPLRGRARKLLFPGGEG